MTNLTKDQQLINNLHAAANIIRCYQDERTRLADFLTKLAVVIPSENHLELGQLHNAIFRLREELNVDRIGF